MGPDEVDERIDNWWRDEDLRDVITASGHVFLVAVDADEGGAGADPVGLVHAGPHPEGDRYVVPRLYVHPDRWGAGIGTALLDHVVTQVQGETDRLQTVLLAGNEVGVGFYEGYGFERVAESGLEDAGERELVYELALDTGTD
jgi:GNAT superfamily N-acetyltransferase